mmetsp:Transcript_3427/g.5928  ORF Transcript_3427/g.5928 Transcript_3427/m.5928 type:complete len:215 (+) Transcript_3427:312-956(+)
MEEGKGPTKRFWVRVGCWKWWLPAMRGGRAHLRDICGERGGSDGQKGPSGPELQESIGRAQNKDSGRGQPKLEDGTPYQVLYTTVLLLQLLQLLHQHDTVLDKGHGLFLLLLLLLLGPHQPLLEIPVGFLLLLCALLHPLHQNLKLLLLDLPLSLLCHLQCLILFQANHSLVILSLQQNLLTARCVFLKECQTRLPIRRPLLFPTPLVEFLLGL